MEEEKIIEITDLIKIENIQFIDSVEDWIDAISVAVSPLIKQGYCEERYIDGIIENTYKFGPYYVLCENLALIHADADKGVNKTQLAITILDKPIRFKDGGLDVRILIALAAKDAESHIYAMQAISNIFSNEKKVENLLTTKHREIVYNEFVSSINS